MKIKPEIQAGDIVEHINSVGSKPMTVALINGKEAYCWKKFDDGKRIVIIYNLCDLKHYKPNKYAKKYNFAELLV